MVAYSISPSIDDKLPGLGSIGVNCTKFRSAAHIHQLLLDEPVKQQQPTPTAQCGISVAWLQQFQQLTGQQFCLESIDQLVQRVILPCTRFTSGKCRLWDISPASARGPPQYYIVYTRSDSLEHLVTQLVQFVTSKVKDDQATAAAAKEQEDEENDTGSQELTEEQHEALREAAAAANHYQLRTALETTYVWLDVVAVYQHSIAAATSLATDLEEVRAAITAADKGTLVIIDSRLELLNRCWCMYEAWAAVYYGHCERLQVLFPDDLTLEDLVAFSTCCNTMDLSRGYTSKPADKQRILAEVKHKVGLRRMQQLLPDSLMRSARAGLRWSNSLTKVSMYCALLLKVREWHQVQCVLHHMPEIHDDEKTLQDIRDVFRLYDQDGSGELDANEFVEVLGVAGFTTDEARKIFDKVDVDKGGSVSLAEFETWWIESQRQQSTRHNTKCDYTVDALMTNIRAMVALLERHGLEAHVPFFRSALMQLQVTANHATRQGKTSLPLQPSPVKGDWHSVAEQCAWKVSTRDFKGACQLMHNLLLWNADTLAENPNLLPHPTSPTKTAQQLQLLINYMEQFGALLLRIPTNYRQAEYFVKAAEEIRETLLQPLQDKEDEARGLPRNKSRKARHGLMVGATSSKVIEDDSAAVTKAANAGSKPKSKSKTKGQASKSKKTGKKLFPGRYDMQREAIVSDMVKLKYGSDTLISASHIVEAEKSLSAWMAAQKSIAGKGVRQNDREAVANFTHSYLAGSVGLPTTGGNKLGGEELSLPALKPGTRKQGASGGEQANASVPSAENTTGTKLPQLRSRA